MIKLKLLGYIPSIEPKDVFGFSKQYSDLVWWRKESPIYYPCLLVSAYHGINYAPDFRERLNLHDILIMGDSGGFQLSKGKVVDVIKSLRWQERNCDIGMGLDIPPTKHITPEQRLEISFKYHVVMEKNRQNYDMLLLKVFHAPSLAYMKLWYKNFKDLDMDGWAISPKNTPFVIWLAVMFCYLYEKGEIDDSKWVHVFALSGKESLPVVYYIKSIIKKDITFDSSTWAMARKFRRYFSPINYSTGDLQIGDHITSDRSLPISTNELDEFGDDSPCICPICTKYPLTKQDPVLIAFHNLYVILQWCAFLNYLSKKREKLREWIVRSFSNNPKVLGAVEIIDAQLEKGFDAVEQQMEKYYEEKYKGKKTEHEVFKQTTLI